MGLRRISMALAMAPSLAGAAALPADQQEFCALAATARTVPATANDRIGAWLTAHVSGKGWIGTVVRVGFSHEGYGGAEVEICPDVTIGNVSPPGVADPQTWAEFGTHPYIALKQVRGGMRVTVAMSFDGIYQDKSLGTKIAVRARLNDIQPLPAAE